MIFNGVEILRMQFSRAVDQTFEHFLDAWSMPAGRDEARVEGFADNGHVLVDIPVISSSN
jgi:hypothetical protein